MTNKQYSSNHGSEWHTLKRYHECHICQSEVVHNYDCLKSHLGSTSHQHLSPREYYVIYVQGKEENVDAPAEEFPEIDGSNQVCSLNQFYSVDFFTIKDRTFKKCVFNKGASKVSFSCS